MAIILNWEIVLNKYELKLCYYVYFRTNTFYERHELPYPPAKC